MKGNRLLNPKKTRAARRPRPADAVENGRYGFRDKAGRFILKYWYKGVQPKHRSRSRYAPHQGAQEIARRLDRLNP